MHVDRIRQEIVGKRAVRHEIGQRRVCQRHVACNIQILVAANANAAVVVVVLADVMMVEVVLGGMHVGSRRELAVENVDWRRRHCDIGRVLVWVCG